MVDKESVFVLGAQDPEMREIERTLRRAGLAFVHAARRGERFMEAHRAAGRQTYGNPHRGYAGAYC